MRVLTWNVARGTARLAEQAAALASREPDVVALQEVTERSLPLWRAALEVIGLPHARCSLEAADPAREPASRRRTGVLLAARGPLSTVTVDLAVPWSETTLGARAGEVEVHTVHVPNAANGWVKVRTLEGLRAGLAAAPPAVARIVCGDFNVPRRELPDGSVLSFARDSRGRLERGLEWDKAELGVIPGLRDLGYTDTFRTLHGYRSPEPSWTWARIAGHGGGWRLDHLFASAALRPVAAVYHHGWREAGLSDHSALEADLEPAG